MDSRRLATMARRLGSTKTRRGTLAGALLALTVPVPPLRGVEVQAKKGKKKCKPKQPKQIPELSCQEACPGICFGCATRNEGSLLCNGGFASGTQRCRTDEDCLGTDPFLPYCLVQTEVRDTGEIDNLREGSDGVCGRAFACAA